MKNIFSFFIVFLFLQFSGIADDTTTVVILHTNDMHSHIDKFSSLASYVKMFRQKYENVFLFSAGDLFTGNPVVDKYKAPGYPIIDLMNKVKYDVSEIGNHEFDYGQATLNKRMEQATFPFICANMKITHQSILKQPKPMVTFYTKDSLKIMILGLLQLGKNGLPDAMLKKMEGIQFSNPIKIAKHYQSYHDSCNVFIALTHLGANTDKILAEKAPFFDVIIGGHSHTKLPNGIKIGNTLITQAGCYMDYLGVLSLKLVNGKVVSKQDSLITLVMGNHNHDDISQLIEKYNQDSTLNTVIGQAKQDLTAPDMLGNLITDAMRQKLNVDIAFQNIGGIRLDKIPQGNITVKQIYQLQPFDNTFITYNLTPKQIKQLIKYAFNLYHKNELEVSGINIKLHVNSHQNLKGIDLFDLKGNPLNKGKFTVAINNYMASAYKLPFLKKGKATNILDAETTIEYIKKHQRLNVGSKRITIVKE